MPWLQAKRVLRDLAGDRLPPALLRLPKHGFSAPAGAWIAGQYRSMFVADVLSPSSFTSTALDLSVVQALLDAHCNGAADHSAPLWAIWMMERWHQSARAASRAKGTSEAVPVAAGVSA
jgi:asparagine synthase (glutamine-hydrolysing)